MATVTLSDNSPLTANATIAEDAVLGSSPTSLLHFLRSDVIGALDQPLDKLVIDSFALGFNFQPEFSVKGGTAVFSAGGSLTGSLEVFKPAKPGAKPDTFGDQTPDTKPATPAVASPLFPADQYGSAIDMKHNCYLALGLQLAFKSSLADTLGAYTLTPAVSTVATAKLYLPFAPGSDGAYLSLRSALTLLLEAYALPSTVAEMLAHPAGAVFVHDAQGKVCFNTSLDLLAVVNPTASLGVASSAGILSVTAGPALTIGGGFTLSGEFQIRLWNKDGRTVQLGYYKKQGTTFSVTFDASVGADVTVGSFDVVAKIYGLLGSQGKLDPAWLKANIPASVADQVQEAYKAAVQTKLSIAIDEECDTTLASQVAFSWDFDSQTMQAEAQEAFAGAIKGDLSALLGVAKLPTGVTKVGSVFDHLSSRKHAFTFNFLGLFDYASVEQASLDSNVKVSEDGQVVIADKATLTRLEATATPFIKSDLLRKVLAEEFVATAGYTTSLGHLTSSLVLHYTYYEYQRRAQASDLQTFVGIAAVLTAGGLGPVDAGRPDPARDWAALLHAGASSQAASVLASLTYDNAAANRLFYDGASAVRSAGSYEAVARKALTLTPGLGLHDSFVACLKDDALWSRLVDAGSPGNVYAALGADPAQPPAWAQAAYAWLQHILAWAPAMHSAAVALEEVRAYAGSTPDLDPLKDAGFTHKRQVLASQLRAAVRAAPLFHDALGILTIALAAQPQSTQVSIRYAGKAATYS
jgi:hypothetical protein